MLLQGVQLFAPLPPRGCLRDEIEAITLRGERLAELRSSLKNYISAFLLAGSLEYIRYLDRFFATTRIIMTRQGRHGLAPSRTKIGDALMIVQGAGALFIFREDEYGRFRNVDQAYIRGFMLGEGLEKKDFKFRQVSII